MKQLAVAAAALLVAAGCSSSDSGGETRGTLAFAAGECCGDPERIPLDIWLMNGDGSDSRQLTRDAGSQFTPSWSPSGRLLVVGSPEGLYVIDADGSGRRKLVRSGAVHPIWSPNGEEIAFTRNTDGYVVEADGSGLRRLGNGFPGDWSPDGEKIAVTDNSQIRVVGADGGGARRLSRPEGNDYEPEWSPDGKKIAFAGVRGQAIVLVDVYVMNADGTGERRVTKFPNQEGDCYYAGIRGIDWSPDGEWIAFARTYVGCDKLGDIYVVRPDGSDLTRLTTSGYAVDPVWRPLRP